MNTGNKLTPEKEKVMARLFREGLRIADVAQKIGMSQETVRRHSIALRIHDPRVEWPGGVMPPGHPVTWGAISSAPFPAEQRA